MPIPDEGAILEGGCFCRAIRYKVHIPSVEQRPVYPAGGADTEPVVRLPVLCTDNCDDCRPATGSILPCWLLSAMETVSLSCMPLKDLPRGGRLQPDAPRTASYQPAEHILASDKQYQDTTLVQFASSKNRRRIFCSRCGTMFGYRAISLTLPEGWPVMLDLVLGTIDRQDLEQKQLKPERHLWWDSGIGWVKNMALHGTGEVPMHPKFDLSKSAGEP